MSKLIVFSLVTPLLLLAADFEYTARVDGAASKHELEIVPAKTGAKLWLSLPPRTSLHLTVQRDTSQVLDLHLTASGPLELRGSGRHRLVVSRDSGSGVWSCRSVGGSATLTAIQSYADTLFAPKIVFTTELDEVNWYFNVPRSGVFVLQSLDNTGKPREELQLGKDNRFQFIGPGTGRLVVKVLEGAGNYSARLQ